MLASNVNKHRKIFEKFTTLCRAVSSFSDCQKHEYITVKKLQVDEEMKTLQCLHFLSITHVLIVLLVWFLRTLDFISYSFLFKSVAVSNNPIILFLRAIPENIDRRQSTAELARAIIDGGQYSKILPEINSYYMDYYPGLFSGIPLRNSYYRVSIFPHSDWIRRDTEYLVGMQESTNQKDSEYGHFSRGEVLTK